MFSTERSHDRLRRTECRLFASIAFALSVLVVLAVTFGDAAAVYAVVPSGAEQTQTEEIRNYASTETSDDENSVGSVSDESGQPRADESERSTSDEPAQKPAIQPEDQFTPQKLPETLESDRSSKDNKLEKETTKHASESEISTQASRQLDAVSLAGNSCSVANMGTGSHAQSLCWLDLNGLSTEYVEVSRSTVRRDASTRPYRYRTTLEYESVLGAEYGSVSVFGDGSSNTESTSKNQSVTNAVNSLATQLLRSGNLYYGSVVNFPITVPLSGDYRFQALISVTAANGSSGLAATAVNFPTWSGAFLGNNNFYTGVSGKPAIYQSETASGTTTVKLSEIKMLDGAGNRVLDYTVVVADAESTDAGESITWSHTNGTGFKWLPNNPTGYLSAVTAAQRKTAAIGNACNATSTSDFQANLTAPSSPSCSSNQSQASPKSGTAMLQIGPTNSTSNFQVSQTMVGSGRQAVAFGIVLGGAQVTVEVTDRIVDLNGAPAEDNFTARLTRTGGSVAQATTGPRENSATTGPQNVPLDPLNAAQLTFSSQATGTTAASYAAGWVCQKSTPGSSVLVRWPTAGSSPTPPTGANAQVRGGEFLDCTVTYTPPYLTLVKSVNNGATGAPNTAADFTLHAKGSLSASSLPGSPVVKRAVAIGDYALSETSPTGPGAWRFGYDWSNLACVANTGSTARGAFTRVQDPVTSVVTAGSINVFAGNDVTCTFTNRANQPELLVKKESDPATGDAVDAGKTVKYTLTFDNSLGTAATEVNYVDHLKDVLDDATFVAGSMRYGDGVVPPTAVAPLEPGITAAAPDAAQQINITGTVPARKIRTMSFTVVVKANETDAAERQSSTAPFSGYVLRNFLTEAGETVPDACELPVQGSLPLCAENPVRAWTVTKNSQPEDGAMIHVGGNIYYRVKVSNVRGENITGVKLKDDLTQTLAATVWDPQAPPVLPGSYGVSYYGGIGGDELLRTDPWDPSIVPKPIFSGSSAFDPEFPDGSPFPGGKWTFEPPPFDIPAQINGKDVAYAIVGYAVRGGSVADPVDATQPYTSNGVKVDALPNAVWVNTVQAEAASVAGKLIPPNRCSSADGDLPPGDTGTNYDCKTWHTLGDSYFHIWKKTSDLSTQQNNNLVGSSFVLADTESAARNGQPSRWLCRTEYRVPNPTDPVSEPVATVGSLTGGTFDYGENSSTHESIETANLSRARYNAQQGFTPNSPGYRPTLQQCGQFYHLDAPSEGQAAGTWRAKDIMGGDTTSGGSAPLANWRNASGFNNGSDASEGRRGTYWLVETVAPEDHQLLSQPMKMWVAPSAPTPEGMNLRPGDLAWYDYQGRLSLPVLGLGQSDGAGLGMNGGSEIRAQCVSPYQLPANRQASCVMPTGWSMPVFDVKLSPLPLTGGQWSDGLHSAGLIVFVLSFSVVLWRRRHRKVHRSTGGGAY